MKDEVGHKIVDKLRVHDTLMKHRITLEEETRWEELKESLIYHVNLAGKLDVPSRFCVSSVSLISFIYLSDASLPFLYSSY